MDKTFMKEGKSAEEVEEVLNYVIKEDLNPSEMKGLYDNWAKQYDEDIQSIMYEGPIILANEVECFYGDQKDIRILDVAAGTGLCGKQLHIKGFHNLDALDPSPEMLEKAKETGCYKLFYEQFLGQKKLEVPADSYDVLVTAASFSPGHLNEDCYEDLISITKIGGHIFILMNQTFFTNAPEYSKNLEPRILELQERGLWKCVLKKINIQKYSDDNMGVLFVMQRC